MTVLEFGILNSWWMFEFSSRYSDCLASMQVPILPTSIMCTAVVACCQSWTACRL